MFRLPAVAHLAPFLIRSVIKLNTNDLAFSCWGSSVGGDRRAVVWSVAGKGGAERGAGSAGSGARGVEDAPPPDVAEVPSTAVGYTMTGRRQDCSDAGIP
jgi:hypothetical protein